MKVYVLTVQASYNQTLSEESDKVTFSPFRDTVIGPPKVSLAGCGYCIHLNISLPEADQSSGIKDMKTVYLGVQYEVLWREHKGAVQSAITRNNSYTVNNLQIGTEYCVQVHIRINSNRNTQPSAWNCTFTSIVEPSRDPVFVGAGAALLTVTGALMSFMFGLYYTGFLCKMKSTLPRVLIEELSQGYTLTPERTVPDNISIGAETEKQRKHNNPPAPQAATRGTDSDEEEEEEEEEGENIYMDRDAELSSGENSCQDSVDALGNSKVAVSGGSGSSAVKAEVQDTEFEVEIRQGVLDQNEAKAEGTEVSFMPEGPVTGQVKEEEEDKEEVCESIGNINLFSVTLAALEGDEGEEQNTREYLTDCLSDLEPLLPTNSKRTLSHTDDRTTLALTLPTHEDFAEGGYEARRMNTSSGCLSTCDGETQHEETQEEEEEEEEEEFSGYMGHT